MSNQIHNHCGYPYCTAPCGQYKYCLPHIAWIKHNDLCDKCLKKKEKVETTDKDAHYHTMCHDCFLAERMVRSQQKRRQAIDAGLCTNWWKCSKSALHRGSMCPVCYEEYCKQRGFIKVPTHRSATDTILEPPSATDTILEPPSATTLVTENPSVVTEPTAVAEPTPVVESTPVAEPASKTIKTIKFKPKTP